MPEHMREKAKKYIDKKTAARLSKRESVWVNIVSCFPIQFTAIRKRKVFDGEGPNVKFKSKQVP